MSMCSSSFAFTLFVFTFQAMDVQPRKRFAMSGAEVKFCPRIDQLERRTFISMILLVTSRVMLLYQSRCFSMYI